MFLEIFCLGCFGSLLFFGGKAAGDSLGRKIKAAANKYNDDDYECIEIDIEDQVRNKEDETGYCYILKAYKDWSGECHAVLKNLGGWGAFVHADTIEELNDKIDKEYIELAKRR